MPPKKVKVGPQPRLLFPQPLSQQSSSGSLQEDSGELARDSPDEDMANILAAIKNRMSKKAADREKKLHSECDRLCQKIRDTTHEHVSKQEQAIEALVTEHEQHMDDLMEERLNILQKLKNEAEKFKQIREIYLQEYWSAARIQTEADQQLIDDVSRMSESMVDAQAADSSPGNGEVVEVTKPTQSVSSSKRKRTPDAQVVYR
ncbi:hypothetical protein SpCBS45565_g02160 [Spizellomyces sp. 'palustris']|nr:hypothetical protein SpCBS45565_g02160 [Spizellomyces sp. 'palustris']